MRKPRVPPAGHRYRPLNMPRATAHKVASLCMRCSIEAKLTLRTLLPASPTATGALIIQGARETTWFRPCIGRQRSGCRGPRHGEIGSYRRHIFRDCSTFLPRLLKLTSVPPRPDRKRSARADGRLRNGPRDVAVPRTSRNRSPPRSRFATLFASPFPPFLGRKAVYDLDILGASHTNFQVRKKSCIHLSHVFAAFRSFYALESPIAEIL